MSANIAMEWDKTGEHFYETGVDRGVLYPMDNSGNYEAGEAWNGLTSTDESPSGADSEKIYADNGVYLNLQSAEEFGGTIGAYTYPDGFRACNGEASMLPGVAVGQQSRKSFGYSYRTKKGNEANPDLGYLIHLWYGCKASPSEKSYSTVNDSPEAIEFSWEVSTTPMSFNDIKDATDPTKILVKGGKTSQVTIDTVELLSAARKAGTESTVQGYLDTLEEILYGKADNYVEADVSEGWAAGTTYYTKSGDVYTKVNTTTTPTPEQGVTYYILSPTPGRLPDPEEVYKILTGQLDA